MALPKQTLLPPPKNQPSDGFVDSAESKKEINGQDNPKVEEKASLLNPPSPPSPPENQGVSFFKKNKTLTIALSLILALVAIGGGVYLVQQRAAIKPKAAPEDVPLCAGMPTIRCWGECQPDTCKEYEVCELAGGGFCQNRKINDNSPNCGAGCGGGGGSGIGDCDDGQGGCCDPNDPYKSGCGCNNWEECAVGNGACASGKSCRVKECRQNGASCSENWQCCSGYCTNGICQGETRTCNSCADCGKEDDSTCTADPNCTSPGQDGFCCKSGSKSYCCYRNCECYEGQQGNCENKGNGKIWLKGRLNVEVYKMTGTSVTCPYSSANRTTVFNGTTAAGGQEFSLGANECGQIEAIGYCGSCKPGCFPGQPTATPTPRPTATPTPTPTLTPTPTPTPIPYSCNCTQIKFYSLSWQPLSPQDIFAGQTIYIAVAGSEAYPQYQFDKGRIRINESIWEPSHETTNIVPQKDNEFYITYTAPPEGGRLVIEGEIHLNATISDPEGTDWWR